MQQQRCLKARKRAGGVNKSDSSSSVKVFIVEDDEGMRRSLQLLVRSIGFEVEAYESAEDFLAGASIDRPGCVLADLRLPGMDGVELLRTIRQRGILMPLVILTAYGDVESAVDGCKLGALEYLEKPVDPEALVDCVERATTEGQRWYEQQTTYDHVARCFESLTNRERDILELLTNGAASKNIAFELNLSKKTVDKYRAKIMAKFRASNAVDLVRRVTWAQQFETSMPESGPVIALRIDPQPISA